MTKSITNELTTGHINKSTQRTT